MRERAHSGAAPVSCSSKGLRGPSVGRGLVSAPLS